MQNSQQILIDEITHLLQGGSAHAGFEDALNDLPADKRGVVLEGMPYSIWQLVEHIGIAQWDMLQFCKDVQHKSPKWPEEYWPKETEPESEAAWLQSTEQIAADLEEMIGLVKTRDLYTPFPHGTGQNLLREALQLADHNAYHVAEIIVLRRIMGCWNPPSEEV